MELGAIAAQNLNPIILRCDKDLRGRTQEEILGLLEAGVRSVNATVPVIKIPDEKEALQYAYDTSTEGSLIVVMCDTVAETLEKVKMLKQKEEDLEKSATVSLLP